MRKRKREYKEEQIETRRDECCFLEDGVKKTREKRVNKWEKTLSLERTFSLRQRFPKQCTVPWMERELVYLFIYLYSFLYFIFSPPNMPSFVS